VSVPGASWTNRAVAAVLVAALAAGPLAGCGRKGAADAPGGSAASRRDRGSEPTAQPKDVAGRPKPGVIPTNTLVPSAPAEAFEPPSYDGFEPLPSFTYHHVDPKLKNELTITPAVFEAQLKMLKDGGYHPITARQLAEYHEDGAPLPEKPVMITFDDGWKNQFTYAAPLLKKYGFSATFFVNPQLIGYGGGYMTRDMLISLRDAGHDIESHTWTHKALTRRGTEDRLAFQRRIMKQMTLADAWLTQVVGRKPVALCYPFGYYDVESVGRAQAAGYTLGFTTDEGVADARPWHAMVIKRFTIGRGISTAGFASRLSSGPLQVRAIDPPPGTRVRGITTTVTVDITDVPSSVQSIKLTSGPSMKSSTIVRRDGRRFVVGRIRKAKVGSRQVTVSGEDASGRRYYASWSLVMGD